MRLTELTDSEILLQLEALSQQYSVKLSFAHKLFYVSLLHLCEKKGDYDVKSNQYYAVLSVNAFAQTFRVSTTTVVQSLKLLNECNAIRREKHMRVFRKLSRDNYIVNGAYRTYVNTIFLACNMKGE